MAHIIDQPERDEKDFAEKQIQKANKSIEGQLERDGGKDADPILKGMVDESVNNLRKTIPQERSAEFDAAAKNLTDEFDREKAAIMQSKGDPEVKRSKLTMAYTKLREELEAAQGKIVGPEGTSQQKDRQMAEMEAKKSENAAERFRKDYEEMAKARDLDRLKAQQKKNLDRHAEHEKEGKAEAKLANSEADSRLQLV